MKTKPDIIIDFDETLFETSREMRRFLNYRFGTQIPLDLTNYMCGHSLHEFVMRYLPEGNILSESELYEILGNEFLASKDWHKKVVPIDGAQKTILELAKCYTMHIATARQKSSKPVVIMLLKKYFPDIFSSIHFVWEHLGQGEFKGVPKKEFIKTLNNPIAYIDDNPKETRDVGNLVQHVILFDPYGHYSREMSSMSQRVIHWYEIRELLLRG